MRKVYLRNGTAVYLHMTLPDGTFVVEPIYLYDDPGGEREGYEEGCGEKLVVNEIFDKAPVELIDAEYAMAQETWSVLTAEISILLDDKFNLEKEIGELTDLLITKGGYRTIDETHDDLLTPAQIEGKRVRKSQQVADSIAKQESIVEQAQNELKRLRGESEIPAVKRGKEILGQWEQA